MRTPKALRGSDLRRMYVGSWKVRVSGQGSPICGPRVFGGVRTFEVRIDFGNEKKLLINFMRFHLKTILWTNYINKGCNFWSGIFEMIYLESWNFRVDVIMLNLSIVGNSRMYLFFLSSFTSLFWYALHIKFANWCEVLTFDSIVIGYVISRICHVEIFYGSLCYFKFGIYLTN